MRRSNTIFILFLVIIFLSIPGPRGHPAWGQAIPQNRLRTAVFGAAGATATGSGMRMGSTLGQPSAIGVSSAADGSAYLGFWYGRWPQTVTETEDPELPAVNRLYQNYPNPFNPVTTITFSLSKGSFTSLNIYNVEGKLLRVLVNRVMDQGSHRVEWDGKNRSGQLVSSGIYFYKLKSDRFEAVRKMVLLR